MAYLRKPLRHHWDYKVGYGLRHLHYIEVCEDISPHSSGVKPEKTWLKMFYDTAISIRQDIILSGQNKCSLKREKNEVPSSLALSSVKKKGKTKARCKDFRLCVSCFLFLVYATQWTEGNMLFKCVSVS